MRTGGNGQNEVEIGLERGSEGLRAYEHSQHREDDAGRVEIEGIEQEDEDMETVEEQTQCSYEKTGFHEDDEDTEDDDDDERTEANLFLSSHRGAQPLARPPGVLTLQQLEELDDTIHGIIAMQEDDPYQPVWVSRPSSEELNAADIGLSAHDKDSVRFNLEAWAHGFEPKPFRTPGRLYGIQHPQQPTSVIRLSQIEARSWFTSERPPWFRYLVTTRVKRGVFDSSTLPAYNHEGRSNWYVSPAKDGSFDYIRANQRPGPPTNCDRQHLRVISWDVPVTERDARVILERAQRTAPNSTYRIFLRTCLAEAANTTRPTTGERLLLQRQPSFSPLYLTTQPKHVPQLESCFEYFQAYHWCNPSVPAPRGVRKWGSTVVRSDVEAHCAIHLMAPRTTDDETVDRFVERIAFILRDGPYYQHLLNGTPTPAALRNPPRRWNVEELGQVWECGDVDIASFLADNGVSFRLARLWQPWAENFYMAEFDSPVRAQKSFGRHVKADWSWDKKCVRYAAYRVAGFT